MVYLIISLPDCSKPRKVHNQQKIKIGNCLVFSYVDFLLLSILAISILSMAGLTPCLQKINIREKLFDAATSYCVTSTSRGSSECCLHLPLCTNSFLQASFIQINPSLDVPHEDPFLLLIICHKSEVQSWPGKMPAGITGAELTW